MANSDTQPAGIVARLPHADLAPIRSRRWRGRFPSNVVNRRARDYWVYLEVGDEAEIFDFSKDHGKRVRVHDLTTADEQMRLQLEGRGDLWFVVKAIGFKFHFEDGKSSAFTAMHCKELRRAGEVANV